MPSLTPPRNAPLETALRCDQSQLSGPYRGDGAAVEVSPKLWLFGRLGCRLIGFPMYMACKIVTLTTATIFTAYGTRWYFETQNELTATVFALLIWLIIITVDAIKHLHDETYDLHTANLRLWAFNNSLADEVISLKLSRSTPAVREAGGAGEGAATMPSSAEIRHHSGYWRVH